MTNLTTIVIFGASGDLTRRKLDPGAFSPISQETLVGTLAHCRRIAQPMSDEEFRQKMTEGVQEFARYEYDDEEWEAFAQGIHYVPGDLTKLDDFERLEDVVEGERMGTFTSHLLLKYCAAALRKRPGQSWRGRYGIRRDRLATGGDRETVSAMICPRLAHSMKRCTRCLKSRRFTGSIITSARKRCRTSWFFALPTLSLSRCGIAIISTTCR